MKRLKKIALSILGVTVLSLALYACSNDGDVQNHNTSNTKSNNELLSYRTSRYENFTDNDYNKMLFQLNDDIDLILSNSKPKDITLENYKLKLINGEIPILSSDYNKILELSEELSNYGVDFAIKNKIDIDIEDFSSTISIGGLYGPSDEIDTKYDGFNSDYNYIQAKLGPKELLVCGAVAIGADALWALGGSSASAWTAAAMTKAFTAIAKRFLGPVGVAIAVVSFGVCLAQSAK